MEVIAVKDTKAETDPLENTDSVKAKGAPVVKGKKVIAQGSWNDCTLVLLLIRLSKLCLSIPKVIKQMKSWVKERSLNKDTPGHW